MKVDSTGAIVTATRLLVAASSQLRRRLEVRGRGSWWGPEWQGERGEAGGACWSRNALGHPWLEACGRHGGEFPLLPYRASWVRGHFIMAPVKPLHNWNLWAFSIKTKHLLVDAKPCTRVDEQLMNHRWRSGSHDPASLVHEQNGGTMKQDGTVGRDSSTLIYNPLLIKSCIFHWLIHTLIWCY